jgi:hypothetical protein
MQNYLFDLFILLLQNVHEMVPMKLPLQVLDIIIDAKSKVF